MKNRSHTQSPVFFFAFAILLGGTSCKKETDDHTHWSPYPACDAIIQACYELDIGEGPIHACHDFAHGAANEAVCVPKKDECLRICSPTGNSGLDAGSDASDAAATVAAVFDAQVDAGNGATTLHDH